MLGARHTVIVGARSRWPVGTAQRIVGTVHPGGPRSIGGVGAEVAATDADLDVAADFLKAASVVPVPGVARA